MATKTPYFKHPMSSAHDALPVDNTNIIKVYVVYVVKFCFPITYVGSSFKNKFKLLNNKLYFKDKKSYF